MDGFDIRSPRFARYILSNAALETLAAGFRWIEGPVWMGDANCLLFQDLPTTDAGSKGKESVYRAPSHLPTDKRAIVRALDCSRIADVTEIE
jgi:gluconolactonase